MHFLRKDVLIMSSEFPRPEFLSFVITRRKTYLASSLVCVCRSFSLAAFERNGFSSAIPSPHVNCLVDNTGYDLMTCIYMFFLLLYDAAPTVTP